MGIDIYVSWPGMTKEEREAQHTGFSVVHGNVGYLREAYHGGPYATKVLVPEAFDDDAMYYGAEIPASVLRERLPDALEAARTRARRVYEEDASPELLKSYEQFVALCERKEAETGKPCRIFASY